MLDLVKYIVNSLVDDAEKTYIEIDGNNIIIYSEKDEIGKIIGKQGRIAKAIRTIVKAASIKDNSKWSVEIVEK